MQSSINGASSGADFVDPRTHRSARGHHAHFFLNLQRERSDIIPVSVREAVAQISQRREAFERQQSDFTSRNPPPPSAAAAPHNPFVEMQRRDAERREAAAQARQAAWDAKMEQRHRPMSCAGGGASVNAKLRKAREEEESAAAAAAARSSPTQRQPQQQQHVVMRRPHSSPAAAAALMASPFMRLPAEWEEQRRKEAAAPLLPPSPRGSATKRAGRKTSLAGDDAAGNDDDAAALVVGPHGRRASASLRYEDIPEDDGDDGAMDDEDDEFDRAPPAAVHQNRRGLAQTPTKQHQQQSIPLSSSRPPSSPTARVAAPRTFQGIVPTSPPASSRPATASGSAAATSKATAAAAGGRGAVSDKDATMIMRRIQSAGVSRVVVSNTAGAQQPQSEEPARKGGAPPRSTTATGSRTSPRPYSAQQQHAKDLLDSLLGDGADESDGNNDLIKMQSSVAELPTSASVAPSPSFQPRAPLEEERLRVASANLADVTTGLFSRLLSSRGTFHSLVKWADTSLAEALGAAENEKSETEPAWVSAQLASIPELRAVSGPGVSAVATTLLVLNSIMTCDPAVSHTWGGTWTTVRNILIAGLFGTDGAYRVAQEMTRGLARFRLSEEEALARALSCVPSLTEAVQTARVRCAVLKKKIDAKDGVIAGLDLALAKHLRTAESRQTRLVWRAWRDYAARNRWQRWVKSEFAARKYALTLQRKTLNAWRRVGITLSRLEAEKQRDAARTEARHAKLILHKSVEDAKATLHEEVTTARRHLSEERSLRQAQVSALTMETERLLGQRGDLQEALELFSAEGRLWHNLWQEHRPRFDLFAFPAMSSVLAKAAAALHDALGPLFARSGNVSLLVAGDSPLIAPQTATVFGLGLLQQTAHHRTLAQIFQEQQQQPPAAPPPPLQNNDASSSSPQPHQQQQQQPPFQPLQLPVETQRQLTRTKHALGKFLLDWANGFLASIPPAFVATNSGNNNISAQRLQQRQQGAGKGFNEHSYHDDDDEDYAASSAAAGAAPAPFSRVLVRDADFQDGVALSLMLRYLLDCARIVLLVPHYPRALVDKIVAVLSPHCKESDVHRAATPAHAVLALFRVALDVFAVFPLAAPPILQYCPFAATHFTPAKMLSPEIREWWQYVLATMFVMYATLPVAVGQMAAKSSAASNSVFTDAVDTRIGDVVVLVAAPSQQQQQTGTCSSKSAASKSAPDATNRLTPSSTVAFRSEEVIEFVAPDSNAAEASESPKTAALETKKDSFLVTPQGGSLPAPSNNNNHNNNGLSISQTASEEAAGVKLTKQQKREFATLASRGPTPLQCLLGQHHFAHHVPQAAIDAVSAVAASLSPSGTQQHSTARRASAAGASRSSLYTSGQNASSSSVGLLGRATSRRGSGMSVASGGGLTRTLSTASNGSLSRGASTNRLATQQRRATVAGQSAGATNNSTTPRTLSLLPGGAPASASAFPPPTSAAVAAAAAPAGRIGVTAAAALRKRSPAAGTAAGAAPGNGARKGGGNQHDGALVTHGHIDAHLAAMQNVVESQQAQWKALLERWQSAVKWESLFRRGNDIARSLLEATNTAVSTGEASNPNATTAAGDLSATQTTLSPPTTTIGDDDDDESSTPQPQPAVATIRGPLQFHRGGGGAGAGTRQQAAGGNSNNTNKFSLPNPAVLDVVNERRTAWEQAVRERAWLSAARIVATAIAEFHALEWQPEQNAFRSVPTPVFTLLSSEAALALSDAAAATASSRGSSRGGASSSSRSRRRSSFVRRHSVRSSGAAANPLQALASFSLDATGPTAEASGSGALAGSREFASGAGADFGDAEKALTAVFERSAANFDDAAGDMAAAASSSSRFAASRRNGQQQQPQGAGAAAVSAPSRREQQVSAVSSMLFNSQIMQELARK